MKQKFEIETAHFHNLKSARRKPPKNIDIGVLLKDIWQIVCEAPFSRNGFYFSRDPRPNKNEFQQESLTYY